MLLVLAMCRGTGVFTHNKGNNKFTELRTIFQKESQSSKECVIVYTGVILKPNNKMDD
jgi:hypothetical protein